MHAASGGTVECDDDAVVDVSLDVGDESAALSPSSPSSAAAAAAAADADDNISKYIPLYSLPLRERVLNIFPCVFAGSVFGHSDKYAFATYMQWMHLEYFDINLYLHCVFCIVVNFNFYLKFR